MKARQIMIALLACSLLTVSCATETAKQDARPIDFPEGQWVDLSHDLSSETVYWPTAEPFKRETVAEGFTEKGYYYSAYSFCAAEHGGTHIDAPVHFAQGRNTVDAIPLSQLIAPAIKIDVSGKAAANRDYQISVEDFADWESANGRIPDGSIVLSRRASVSSGPIGSNTSGRTSEAPRAWPNYTFRGCTRTGRGGWSRTER